MKKFIVPVVLVLVAVVVVGGFILTRRRAGIEVSPGTTPTPAFSLKDYEGRTRTLEEFKGTPLVINSWAAWCPFCREELPDFARVQREFAGKVVFIAIDRAESLETAKRYSDELGVTRDMVFLLDPDDSFYRALGGFSMPETIFVDAAGNIRFHKRGPLTYEQTRERVEWLLKQ